MTEANYPSPVLDFVLKYEGGKCNDAHDPGGRTNQGVTQATYDHYRRNHGLRRRTVFDMMDAERNEIYRKEYWDAIGGDALRAGEDLVVMDFAVNSGPAKALDVWRRCGGRGYPATQIIHDVCAHRLSFMHALRTWRYFGPGWGRRVAACEARATRMAYGKAAPDVLTKKAAEAQSHSSKKTTQAAVGTAASEGAALANHAQTGNTALVLAAGVAIAIMAAVFLFHAWRQRQRAEAFAAEAKK